MGRRDTHMLLVRRKEESLGRPRCKLGGNIKMDLEEIGWGSVDWIGLAQGRDQWRALVNVVMNLWIL
jgi:hypothetical protein